MNNGGPRLVTPPGSQQPARLQQIEEVVNDERLQELLRKQDWTMLGVYPRQDQIFEGELRLVYVMGKVGS